MEIKKFEIVDLFLYKKGEADTFDLFLKRDI